VKIIPAWIVTLSVLLAGCGNPNQRLDEYVFYDGPQFRLKVVRFYRNVPFDQLGERAIVMCRSANTADFPAKDPQDAGWRVLGSAHAQGSDNAKEAALEVKDDYDVFDDHTLIAKMTVLNISFDACGHFINWDPSRLPAAMIDPLEKPDSCAPNGPADCRYFDFEGNRTPRYEQIHVAGKGQVHFTVSSPAFRDVERLHVQTRNNGAVWHVQTVGEKTPGTSGSPSSARGEAVTSLSVSTLENSVEDVSLMDWFESVLPPGSMVIWPGSTVTCGNRHEPDWQTASARCAEIRFTDIEGNNGTLYIAMDTGPENKSGNVSFHSAVYRSGDESRVVGSLAGLREILASGAE